MNDNSNGIVPVEQTSLVAACMICGLHHPPGTPCPVTTMLPIRAAVPELAPGTVIGGRFEIQSTAHRSGMSAVYRALDRHERRTVAVKRFSVGGLSAEEKAESLGWFAREAGLLSSLQNRHLPTLIAAFSEGDDHYVVMPFLYGETIKERVQRQGPLPEEEATRWTRALLEVLSFLHAQDPPVIHRDLKPDNILILRNEDLILLDLGVARPLTRDLPGTAIGTPGYAPPEQYQGLADERSDLYALGATIHYMLTGYDADQEAPFRHPPAQALNARVSPDMDAVVASLLQLAPNQRPSSAGAVNTYLAGIDQAHASVTVRKLIAKTTQEYLTGAATWVGISGSVAMVAALHPFGIRLYVGRFIVGYMLTFFWSFLLIGGWGRHDAGEVAQRIRARIQRAVAISVVPGLSWLLAFFLLLPESSHWLFFVLAMPMFMLFPIPLLRLELKPAPVPGSQALPGPDGSNGSGPSQLQP